MKTTSQRRSEIEHLIASAELDIFQNRRAYNIKVGLFALLGYAVIFGMLFLLIAIIAGIGWAVLASSTLVIFLIKKKIIFALLGMVYVLIKALWVKFESPAGYELNRLNSPLLFQELETLTKKLNTPRIHQVILTPEYNAAIMQTPRLGLFGWYKNTLFLGLELLMSMSPDQARSVLAHELGHLSGEHGRFTGWIYRVRLSWQRIMDSLEYQDGFSASLMRGFFYWYIPKFAAYSFALARDNEYSADKVAAKLTSSEDTAQALVNSHVLHDFLGEFYWRPFLKQADTSPRPVSSPYQQLVVFLNDRPLETEAMKNRINRAMAEKTGHYDTHPALKDRLNALQCEAMLPEPVGQSAALKWLGSNLPAIIKDFDQEWLQRNSSKWNERYEYVKKGKSRLAELKAKGLSNQSPEEIWEYASLIEEMAPEVDSLPLYEFYHRKQPNDANALFAIGRLLLIKDDENGVEKMKLAMEKSPRFGLNACEWIIYFYRKRNNGKAADLWQKQADQQIDVHHAANQEREIITSRDEFVKPDRQLDVENLFAKRIKKVKGVQHAWLAEKRMRYFPEAKAYVLVIEKGFFDQESKLVRQMMAWLDGNFTYFILVKDGEHKEIAEQVIKKGIALF